MAMYAADVMTSPVQSVAPGAGVAEIASLLTARHISSVPVCQPDGTLEGIVSEADVLRPLLVSTKARREHWLTLIAEGEDLSKEFLAYVENDVRLARDLMHREVYTASETTPLSELADMITRHGLRHIPILRDGKVVGIVSRADLVAAIARSPSALE